jgi:hypothetical protein
MFTVRAGPALADPPGSVRRLRPGCGQDRFVVERGVKNRPAPCQSLRSDLRGWAGRARQWLGAVQAAGATDRASAPPADLRFTPSLVLRRYHPREDPVPQHPHRGCQPPRSARRLRRRGLDRRRRRRAVLQPLSRFRVSRGRRPRLNLAPDPCFCVVPIGRVTLWAPPEREPSVTATVYLSRGQRYPRPMSRRSPPDRLHAARRAATPQAFWKATANCRETVELWVDRRETVATAEGRPRDGRYWDGGDLWIKGRIRS